MILSKTKQIILLLTVSISNAVFAQTPDLIPYRKGDLWGYSTPGKKIVIEPKWQESTFYEGELAQVKLNNLWGLIDKSGQEVVPCGYEFISEFVNGIAVGIKPNTGERSLISISGKEQVYSDYSSVGLLKGGLIMVRKNRLYGLMDRSGNFILPCEYEHIKEQQNGYIKTEKELMYSFEFEIVKHDASSYYDRNRTAEVRIDHKNKMIYTLVTKEEMNQAKLLGYNTKDAKKEVNIYGFLDKNGKEILPCQYDEIRTFDNGLMRVRLNQKVGLFSNEGKEILPIKYTSIGDFNEEGYAAISLDSKFGFINENGEEVIDIKYQGVNYLIDGFAMVKKENYWGLVNLKGEEVTSFDYLQIHPFSNGRAMVEKNYLIGYINNKGKEVIPLIYLRQHYPFENGVAIMVKQAPNARNGVGKFGTIDTNGEVLVPFMFDLIEEFKEGLAKVKLRSPQGNVDVFGYVNLKGEQVTPVKYVHAGDFEKGVAYVIEDKRIGGYYINKLGESVIPEDEKPKTIMDTGEDMGNGYFRIYHNRKSGYISKNWVKYYED